MNGHQDVQEKGWKDDYKGFQKDEGMNKPTKDELSLKDSR